MANPKAPSSGPQGAGNVLSISACPTCGKKPSQAGFCTEHFTWFKEGLVNRHGAKVPDFDKKFQDYQRRKKVA